jgi:3-oxoacyl-[acyl-carrier-protein] synthase-1
MSSLIKIGSALPIIQTTKTKDLPLSKKNGAHPKKNLNPHHRFSSLCKIIFSTLKFNKFAPVNKNKGILMKVFVAADNIISPLGFTTKENFEHLKKMQTGIKCALYSNLSATPICAAIIPDEKINNEFDKLNTTTKFTRFEKMVILSITEALKANTKIDVTSNKTLIILSSTKGNINLLNEKEGKEFDKKRVHLWETARVISEYFKNPNKPLIVSNACISGVVAILLAKRLLDGTKYENIIVAGADEMTEFVVSGFQSFKAISKEVAKPYDASRDGISLGEGAGTLIFTNRQTSSIRHQSSIIVNGGASSNDANHISGPSRTGDGLLLAIEKTLKEAGMKPEEIDYISGHGTATIFNDDMEALAVADAGLSAVAMNSLKSYFGHTLGAAGVIESIIGIESMRENTLIGTYNFNESGVPKPVNIIRKTLNKKIHNCLKTSAGFGGCNAAVLFSKN